MSPTFIHSAQFWTWLLEWASQGTVVVMFFLCSRPAQSSCGLWIGPKLYLFLHSRQRSVFQHCLLFLGVSCITIKQHWVRCCSEKVPLYVLLPVWHVMMFPFPGTNGPIIQIIIILWNQLKYCFFLAWSLTGVSLFAPCSIGPHPGQQQSWQLPVSELCVWCFWRSEAVSSYRPVLMGTWRSMSHGSINLSNNWEPLHNATV